MLTTLTPGWAGEFFPVAPPQMRTVEPPQKLFVHDAMLFNVYDDPAEEHDLSDAMPEAAPRGAHQRDRHTLVLHSRHRRRWAALRA